MTRRLLLVLGFSFGVSIVAAQTRVVNPNALIFIPSVDHATLTSYEADIVNSSGAIVQTISLGKPVPNSNNEITVPLNVQPVSFGTYTIRVRSMGVDAATKAPISGVPSTATEQWDRSPGPPSKPRTQ